MSIVFNNEDPSKSPIGYEQHRQITVTRQIVIGGRNKCAHSWHQRLLFCRQRCWLTLHASLGVCAVDEKEIDTAKMQGQGQLAAQYIQDVMQVRPELPPQRRSFTRAVWRCCTLPAC